MYMYISGDEVRDRSSENHLSRKKFTVLMFAIGP